MGRGRSACLALGVALLVSACRDEIGGPPIGDARTMLLVFSLQGGRVAGLAVDVALPLALPYSREEIVDLYALLYRCTFDELEVNSGELELLTTTSTGGREIPNPAAAYHLTANSWAPISGLPPVLASYRIRGPAQTSCAVFERQVFPLAPDPNTDSELALSLTATSALIGTSSHTFFLATLSGPPTPLPELHGLPVMGGFLGTDGRIWLAGREGLFVGRIGSPFTKVATVTASIDGGGTLTGGPGATPELFIMPPERVLQRFDGTKVEVLARPHAVLDASRPDVAYIGPGEALACGLGAFVLTRYRSSTVSEERIPSPELRDPPDQIESAPGLGIVIGSYNGRAWVDRSGRGAQFMELDNSSFYGIPVHVIAPYAGGVLFGGFHGAMAQYSDAVGWCPMARMVPGDVNGIATVGENVFVIGGRDLNPSVLQPPTVTVLKPMKTIPSCLE
jgi:hypothetical protein